MLTLFFVQTISEIWISRRDKFCRLSFMVLNHLIKNNWIYPQYLLVEETTSEKSNAVCDLNTFSFYYDENIPYSI